MNYRELVKRLRTVLTTLEGIKQEGIGPNQSAHIFLGEIEKVVVDLKKETGGN